jgi:DNA replication and repair protein RecF
MVYGFDPEHASRVSAYERVMADRNRLLRERRFDPHWLSALECQLAEKAVAIAAARLHTLERVMQAAEMTDPAFPKPVATAQGEAEQWLARDAARVVEERMMERLAANRHQDAESGRTSIGTHRTDLEVIHTEKGLPARQCSTGEQKIVLLSLILACARARALAAGSAPALLLDEVAAHLDETRRHILFNEIAALNAQAWLTGNDRNAFSALEGRAQFLYVQGGSIQA